MAKAQTVKIKQLAIAQWEGDNGLSYSTLGLGEDGTVYRFDPACQGWIAMPMTLAPCKVGKDHRR